MVTDISILFEEPKLEQAVILVIKPLAPLSMVNNLPGSYYKTERMPTKPMLCGLFENLLGWHFSEEDRIKIFKEMQKYHKKQYNKNLEKEESESGYQLLLGYYFEVTPQVLIPVLKHYEDLWTQHMIGADTRHLDGSVHNSWDLENELSILRKQKFSSKRERDNIFSDYFKKNQDKFPLYYRAVLKREFIIAQGDYRLKLNMNSNLLAKLKEQVKENDIGYLGTSEGWVTVSFQEVKNV
jgi:CRISPR-associated protein Cas5